MDIVDAFKESFRFRVTTSGYVLRKFSINDLKKFDMIQISLQGSSGVIHDSFVAKKGSFDIVTNNIRWLCNQKVNVIVSRSLASCQKDNIDNFQNRNCKNKLNIF